MLTSPTPRRGPSMPINCGTPAVLAAIGSLLVTMSARGSSAIEERIQHIRDGLLPPVLMEGEPPRKETLADEMARLHVPGVSIAVRYLYFALSLLVFANSWNDMIKIFGVL
jgi:hypothetical protein